MSATTPTVDQLSEHEAAHVATVLRSRRRRSRSTTLAVNLARLGLLAAILILWQLAANSHLINAFFWSSPSQVWHAFRHEIGSGTLWTDVWYTARASLLGFVIGTLIGTLFGMALWWSRFVARVFDPYLVAWNAMPKIALAPLVTVTLGLGLASKVLMSVLLVSVIAAIAARDGTRSVDPDQETLLRSLGASRLQTFTKLVFPCTLPWVFSAFRINIGLALIGTVVGEFVGGSHGLGILAVQAAAVYDVATVWVAVFTLGVLALLMYWAVEVLERLLNRTLTHS